MKLILACLVFSTFYFPGYAQERLSLNEIVALARENSISSYIAKTRRENRYWQFRRYQAQYRPELIISGSVPGFNRSFDQVRQPDGTFEFQPITINNSDLSLSLSQNLGVTGTEFFLTSTVRRFDDFERDNFIYNSTPVEVGFRQPLFNYNPLIWDRKIEPLRFEESKREYVEELEEVSINATSLFFNLLLAQVNVDIAQRNLSNNDTIFKIAQGRYNLGKIAENELLQLELNLMNSRQSLAQAKLDIETRNLRLKNFIGTQEVANVVLIPPDSIPTFMVAEERALSEARKNRSDMVAFRRQKLQAEEEIAQAKGNAGLNANLFASFGFSNRAEALPELYVDPANQQILRAGFSVPILDWGRRKSAVKTAQASAEQTNYIVSQQQLNFEQEIFTQVKSFEMLKDQVEIAGKVDEIADKSYEIAKNRFLIGKISITDLNDALEKKDQAKRTYIAALKDFWEAYYNLRLLTLYDFAVDEPLYKPIELSEETFN